jgi:hypothetical protein
MRKDFDYVSMADYKRDTEEIVNTSTAMIEAIGKERDQWKALFIYAVRLHGNRLEVHDKIICDSGNSLRESEELVTWINQSSDSRTFEIREQRRDDAALSKMRN